jgi:hypothetical protein
MRQESFDKPGRSRLTDPEALAKEASQSVSKCEMAIYENGSETSENLVRLFGRVSGSAILKVSGWLIIGITLGSPTRL